MQRYMFRNGGYLQQIIILELKKSLHDVGRKINIGQITYRIFLRNERCETHKWIH